MRKRFSHYGALPSVLKTSPVHYECPVIGKPYFDPGNWIYGVTAILLGNTERYGCNSEIMGDMFESFAGAWYSMSVGEGSAPPYSQRCFWQLNFIT